MRRCGIATSRMPASDLGGLHVDLPVHPDHTRCPRITPVQRPQTWRSLMSLRRARRGKTPSRRAVICWWGGRGSNPRPRDYESPALTG